MAATTALGIAGVSSAGSAYASSVSKKSQGEYQKHIYDMNARMAEVSAKDATARGDKAALEIKRGAKKVIGSQRASYAGQGVEVDSGSAADIVTETTMLSELDQIEVKNNAWREAWGYRVQALDSTTRGQMALSGAEMDSRNTLITGGLQAVTYGTSAVAKYKSIRSKGPQ